MLPDIYPLGPFIVDRAGRLAFRGPDSRPCFWFVWRNRRFSAVLADGTVALSAVLGRVPSSLGGAARRGSAFAALRALPQALPGDWLLRLTPEHRIEIAAEEKMQWPATAAGLIQPLIRFLLALAPTLDLLDEVGF